MKKIKTISLLALSLFLVGCGETTSAASNSSESAAASESSYPSVYLKAKSNYREVEINQSIEISAIVNKGGKATFTCSDTSIASLEPQSDGIRATLTGIKEGKVTVTLTSTLNPNVTSSIDITVIKTKPSLRQVIKNIQALDNYTLSIGEAEGGTIEEYSATELVFEDSIIFTDSYGSPLIEDEDQNGLIGKKVTKDGKVVYIQADGNSFKAENAPIVQCNAGLLTKDNFKGAKDKASQAFQVGEFYSYDAINPDWVTDTKTEDNVYVIDGEAVDDEGVATNITGAYVECLLWRLADKESYEEAVSSLTEGYFWSLAGQVETTITVEASDVISVSIELSTDKTYKIEMIDVDSTSMEYDLSGVGNTMDDATASTPVIASDIEKAITAIKTNNYVQVNSMFPDHKTEIKYNIYYTPDYVFYDCNKEFSNEYNSHIGGTDTEKWVQEPYGYIKKTDGIHKFTYDEANDTVSVSSTKEEGTDANTSLPEYQKYFSTISVFNSDLKYSFGTVQESIWNNHSTKYYHTDSRAVFNDFINYYAPEDLADVIENVKSGLGVTLSSDGKVSVVNGTLGYTPFDGDDSDITQHTYGVDYFELNSFGSATANKVDSKLA